MCTIKYFNAKLLYNSEAKRDQEPENSNNTGKKVFTEDWELTSKEE